MPKVGMFYSIIREEEKLLIKAAEKRGIKLSLINIREQILNPKTWQIKPQVMLERCISTTLGSNATIFFESLGIQVVNPSKVAYLCENKFTTSLILEKNKIPTIQFSLVFSETNALEVVEILGGYPVVLKPVSGSWGRLLAKINDHDALEAVIEQKMVLGSPSHKAFYIQKYIDKKGRDIRVTTIGNKVICAIYRKSEHWISNTARGAVALSCKVSKELEDISLKVSKAVGGGILGIDIFETEKGYIVNEVNHTAEFKNVQRVTGVDVAGAIIDYCLEVL